MASTEQIFYDWLAVCVEALGEDATLFEVQVAKTVYAAVDSDRCIQIGPCSPVLAPSPGAEAMEEFDARLTVVLLSRVGEALSDDAYAAAREDVVAMGHALAVAVFNDGSLGGRTRYAQPDAMPRDFTTINKQPFAVANLVVVFNKTNDGEEG